MTVSGWPGVLAVRTSVPSVAWAVIGQVGEALMRAARPAQISATVGEASLVNW